MSEQYIIVKNKRIPITIKSYKTSKSVKIFFRNDRITITKPIRFNNKKLSVIIKENESFIYKEYFDGLKKNDENKKHWKTGEKIFYQGEEFEIIRELTEENKIYIYIIEQNKKIKVVIPNNLMEENIKYAVDKKIKQLYRNNTTLVIQNRLPYWSSITGIKYNKFTIKDAITRYGSCVSKTKSLRFSSRLIMLSQKIVDAIIVHELCHIVHPNHSKDFYELVEKYVKDYKEIDKWLKKNSKIIII